MIVDPTDPPPLHAVLGPENFAKAWSIPHTRALGIDAVRVKRGEALMRIPYRSDFVGDPATGVLHGGLVTTLLDTTCGMAVFCMAEELVMFATLDLRIDYMRAAEVGRDILGKATCTKFGKRIAFVRGVAYEDDPDHPVAVCQGAFMSLGAGPTPPAGAGGTERTS